jgi:hypothetical protein
LGWELKRLVFALWAFEPESEWEESLLLVATQELLLEYLLMQAGYSPPLRRRN